MKRKKRTRNRYQFKCWHGVIGLVGLSMVLGAVRALAAGPGADARRGSYRNYFIEIADGGPAGWSWIVRDAFGNEIERGGGAVSAGAAWSSGQAFIDDYVNIDATRNAVTSEPLKWLHPSQHGMLLAARGFPAPTNGRRGRLHTPPLHDPQSWQTQWDNFRR
jgi:hypothetical protein